MNIEAMKTEDLQILFDNMKGSGDYRISEVLQELRKRRKNEKKNTKKQSS